MTSDSSRRSFLAAAGLALPAAGLAVPSASDAPKRAAEAPRLAGGKLAYRTLGKTGLKVTEVGYGCMITSDASVIEAAVDMGINYFDTSRWYQKGNNERMVGAALGSRRDRIILSSKVDATTRQGALEELDMSLKELRTDHLDIWYLHGKDKPEAITDELMEAQETARQQGKVRFIGVSTHRLPNIAAAVRKTGKMQVVLSTYNFTMDAAMEEALKSLHEVGIGLVAMKVMAGGRRGKEPRPQMKREGAPAAALKWVLKNPLIATTVPSMTDREQLDQNFQVMSERFAPEDQRILTAWLDQIRPDYCRMCGQCDGLCPKGLPVADMLRYLTYAEGYGQFALGRDKFLALPEPIREVRCGDCTDCPIHCPNGVRVTARLARAQEVFA